MIIPKCSECSSTYVSLLCKVWLNFTNGTAELNGEDSDAAEPFPEPGNNAICRDCEHTFSVSGTGATAMKMGKVFYFDGSGNARANDPSIVHGWYYMIDMAAPVGPFDSEAEARAAIAAQAEAKSDPDRAIHSCRLLVDAYTKAEEGERSVDWEDVDEAFAVAKEALAETHAHDPVQRLYAITRLIGGDTEVFQAVLRSEQAAEAAIKIDMEQANPSCTRADYEIHELEVQ